MRALALTMLAACTASAVQSAEAEQIDSLTWAVRAAAIMPHYRGASPASGVGGSLLYRHREWPGFGLEADLTTTIADGELRRLDFSASTAGGYLAWRTAGRWYLKLRGGVLFEYVEVGGADAWGAGLSGGIGVGRTRGAHQLELELTGIEKAAYMVSLAYYF